MSGGGGETSASSEITWDNVRAPPALLLGVTRVVGKERCTSELWAGCRRKMGNSTFLVGIEGIWWDGSTACSDHRVTDGGILLTGSSS